MVVGLWLSAIVAYAQKDSVASQTVSDGENAVVFTVTPKDSIKALKLAKKAASKRNWATWKPDPKRAMWLAIVCPGAGQIYNRKLWKIPIVYGGFVGCAYAMRWNNTMYTNYSQAYIDIMDSDPNTNSFESFHMSKNYDIETRKTLLKRGKDRFRRWRDLSFFCMVGVYGLSIIDAYVDASLSQFDISDDLSLQIEPAIIGTSKVESKGKGNVNPFSTSGIGISAALSF